MAATARQAFLTAPHTVEIREIPLPDPKPNEIQVRSIANGICMFEITMFNGTESPATFNDTYPWKLGHEGIGIVQKVGSEVKAFREGDYCVSRLMAWHTQANYPAEFCAKYRNAPANPGIMFMEPAECAVRSTIATQFRAGDRVLLYGAGYMGLLNVQILAHSPLADLVVVDINPKNLELARQFGATEIIHGGTPAGTARLRELEATPFDVVIEAAGAERALKDAAVLVRRGGTIVMFAWHHQPRTLDCGLWHTKSIKLLNTAPSCVADMSLNFMQRTVDLLERGVFRQEALVTHTFPFEKVQQALETACARPDGYIKGAITF